METTITRIDMKFVNAYLVKSGEGFVLIDTGMPVSRAKMINELEKAGCVPGSLRAVIITHGDIDHTGNADFIRKKFGAKLAMHKGDVSMVETGLMLTDRKVRPSFIMMKIMHTVMSRSKRFFGMMNNFEKFTPDIILEEGDRLDEYGMDAVVHHLPGHTPGSIGVLMPDGSFFCGDLLNNRSKPTGAQIVENEEKLAETMDKVKGMKIDTVYPGHGKPFRMEKLRLK